MHSLFKGTKTILESLLKILDTLSCGKLKGAIYMASKFIKKFKYVKKYLLYLITYCGSYMPVTILSTYMYLI